MDGGDGVPVERGTPSETTLVELAQKLSELRQHLEQVLTGLNPETAGGTSGEESSLRCHACGRPGSTDEAGWTLRLCADDELHPVCSDCDRKASALPG